MIQFPEMFCEDCDDVIPPKRVKAFNGDVKTCVSCQEDRELDGRFQTHKMDVQAISRCGEVDTINQRIVRHG